MTTLPIHEAYKVATKLPVGASQPLLGEARRMASTNGIRVMDGPAGGHGFRSGYWLIEKGGDYYTVYASVPHGMDYAEQIERVKTDAALSLAIRDLRAAGFEVTTTYTVISTLGEPIAHKLTAYDAAVEIMQHDGHDFDIRPSTDGQGFELWVSRFSRNSPAGGGSLVKSQIYSLKPDRAAAETEIAERVIAARWSGYPEAITDAAWDTAQAELADHQEG